MKTTVEKKKKEFQKTIDKSQKLMYNKYVRLREEKPSRMNFPRPLKLSTLTDGVAVVTWLLHAMIVASVPLNTRKLSALGNVPRLTPVWWNGIHSRLKICRLTLMGSNPITGTKFSCVYKVEFGTMRQDGCTLGRGRNCMREGCNTAKAG